jgi:hypothetical protein
MHEVCWPSKSVCPNQQPRFNAGLSFWSTSTLVEAGVGDIPDKAKERSTKAQVIARMSDNYSP